MSLRKKTVNGLMWTFGQQAGVQAINFVIQIFLARILLPEAFGLIAMLQVFIAISNSLVDGGMTSSLIRTKELDNRDYSTVFFINIIVSFVLYWVLFSTAPLIGQFYNQPELEMIVKVYSLVIIIQSFNAVQKTKLTKEMNFKLQMMMQMPAIFIAGILGIVLAKMGYGVWSLVWMQITNAFLFMIQHWFFSKWTPDFVFDKKKLKYHFNFGYKLTISSLISVVYSNIYRIIIGKYYSAAQLGFYHQANTLRMFPVNNLNSALSKVTYPLFSKLQDDGAKLVEAFKEISKNVIWFVSPVMIFLIVFAEPIFLFVLTEKWLTSVPYFQILAVAAVFYPHSAFSMNIFAAKGRSDLHLKIEVYKKIIGIVILFSLMSFGVLGVVIASAVGMFINTVINSYYCSKLIDFSLFNQFKQFVPFLLLSISLGLGIYILVYPLIKDEVGGLLFELILVALSFFGAYFFISYILKLIDFKKILGMLKMIKK